MKTEELIGYVLNPENRSYVELSLSKPWGISNYISELNGVRYVHRGVKQLDEKIILTGDWKNRIYNVPNKLIDFVQNFSSDQLTREKLDLRKIAKGNRATERHTLGFFIGFMGVMMGTIPASEIIENNSLGGFSYLSFVGCGALFSWGVYSAVASAKGFGTEDYDKFKTIIGASENADYFIHKNLSKEIFKIIPELRK